VQAGVEVVRRGEHVFVINHTDDPVRLEVPGVDLLTASVDCERVLRARGVAVIDQRTGER
jgi:hypothetical protein